MPAGMPKIEVTFLIDANGILQVQAREQRTGKAASIEVKPTYGLAEGDVERMIEDSFTYAEADVETRLLIEARNEADTVLTHVARAMRQGAALMSAEERTAIDAAVQALRQAREGQDRDAIRDRTTDLNHATERLAETLMDSALKGALGTRRADEIMTQKEDPASAGQP
jgi:molecular chaperone DnaK (HSP70)